MSPPGVKGPVTEEEIESSFQPHLEPGETLQQWAVGAARPPAIQLAPLYLLAVLPGLIARYWLSKWFLVGLTGTRLILLRYRGRLKVEVTRAYDLRGLPHTRTLSRFYSAILELDEPAGPLRIKFGLFGGPNHPQKVKAIIAAVNRYSPLAAQEASKPPLPGQFETLQTELRRVLGDAAANFLDTPIVGPKDSRAHLIFGPGIVESPYSTACLIKNTLFNNIFDSTQPLWFVFTEEMYTGSAGPYGPFPAEAPSIWDQPGLLPPELKDRAEQRAIEKIDPYLLQGPVYRQWVFSATTDEIGIDLLHRACASWAPDDPGPKLRSRLFYLQPGVPLIYLANELERATILMAQEYRELWPYTQRFPSWLKGGTSSPKERSDRVESATDREPQRSAAEARQRAIRTVSVLRDKNQSGADASGERATGDQPDASAERGFDLALEVLNRLEPRADESVESYLKRVVDHVRPLRDEHQRSENEDERCSGALDESIWAIYEAWSNETES